jgi:hypothetical protein
MEFLTIDHIKGKGRQHQKKINTQICNWLKRNGYPKGYRVLCYNCNCAIGFFGQCPHKHGTLVDINEIYETKVYKKTKVELSKKKKKHAKEK